MELFLNLGIHIHAQIPKKNSHGEEVNHKSLLPHLEKCISLPYSTYHSNSENHIWSLKDQAFSETLIPFIIEQYEKFLFKRVNTIFQPQWRKLSEMKNLKKLEQFLSQEHSGELDDLTIHSERRAYIHVKPHLYPFTISFTTLYFFSVGSIYVNESRGIFSYFEKMMRKALSDMPLSHHLVIDLF